MGRDGSLDQCRGGLPPLGGQLGWHLIEGHGLHQPVYEHQPVSGQGDQGIPAKRHDRIPDGQ